MSECTGRRPSRCGRFRTGRAGFAIPAPSCGSPGTPRSDAGPHVFLGYYKDEAATREALDADGWLHSGHRGPRRDGFLRITDRKKELLITSAARTSPRRRSRRGSRDPAWPRRC